MPHSHRHTELPPHIIDLLAIAAPRHDRASALELIMAMMWGGPEFDVTEFRESYRNDTGATDDEMDDALYWATRLGGEPIGPRVDDEQMWKFPDNSRAILNVKPFESSAGGSVLYGVGIIDTFAQAQVN